MDALENLLNLETVAGRERLVNSSWNLNEIAVKSEEDFKQARNKEAEKAVVNKTKTCVTHALANVADQINNLASNLNDLIEGEIHEIDKLHYEVNQLEMKGKAFNSKRDMKRLSQFISRKFQGENKRKAKRLRRAHHTQQRYISTEIDYSLLDKVGHGMVITPPKTIDDFTLPRNQRSPGHQIKKELSGPSISDPVWETPIEISGIPENPDAIYEYTVENSTSGLPSVLNVDKSNVYTNVLPVNRADPVTNLSSSPSSLRLRRPSEDSSVAQTPTGRNESSYFMFLKSNVGEYASFDEYQLDHSKRSDNSTPPERPTKSSVLKLSVRNNEPIYAEPPLEHDVQTALNELDDATASIFGEEDSTSNGSTEILQATSLPMKPINILSESLHESVENASPPPSNVQDIPKAPQFDLSRINQIHLQTKQNATPPVPVLPDQTNRLTPCKPDFLTESMINRTKGNLRPVRPNATSNKDYADSAVDSMVSHMTKLTRGTDLLKKPSEAPLTVHEKWPPVALRKPPETRPKPRPKSEMPRPLPENNPSVPQNDWPKHVTKPVTSPPNTKPKPKKTPPPLPPKTKPKPVQSNRFSTFN